MPLREYQTAVGRLVRLGGGGDALRRIGLDDRERLSLEALRATAGFQVTMAIQRSWCEGRAARAAHLTLSAIPEPERKQLLAEWAESGAGTSSFFEADAEAFFDFLSSRLAEGSEALMLCRMERATLRASEGVAGFIRANPARLDCGECVVGLSRFAALVCCAFEPRWVLFAPGVEGLWRSASRQEAALWGRLAAPARVEDLVREGYGRVEIEGLLEVGAIEALVDVHSRPAGEQS